jgi:hypothetical protein
LSWSYLVKKPEATQGEGIVRYLLATLVELNRKRSREKEFSERLFEEEGI